MEQTTPPIVVLGFILGMKHSLDVDHLAAVTTMLPGRRGRWEAAGVGAWWGFGHAATLLAVGGAIIAFDLRFPPAVSLLLEFGVGVMLIVLGLRLLIRLRKGWTVHLHAHSHGKRLHIHPHVHREDARHDPAAPPARSPGPMAARTPAPGSIPPQAAGTMATPASAPGHHPGYPARPGTPGGSFIVGMVHGLAGSAGLTLILLPVIPTRLMGILYLALFGAGSVLGMTLATFLVSIPLGRLAPGGKAGFAVSITAGCLSLIAGAALMMATGGELLSP